MWAFPALKKFVYILSECRCAPTTNYDMDQEDYRRRGAPPTVKVWSIHSKKSLLSVDSQWRATSS